MAKSFEIEIPENVELSIEGNVISAKGEKGEASKELADPKIKIEVKDKKVILSTEKFSRNEKRMINTFTKHIKNLIQGAIEGYTYKLKVCAHFFPMNVAVEQDKVVIKNFLGEKIPRTAKILPNVEVKVDKDIIIIEGCNKETVSQTAANIEQTCRITNRDRRRFQDGCWIIHKAGRGV